MSIIEKLKNIMAESKINSKKRSDFEFILSESTKKIECESFFDIYQGENSAVMKNLIKNDRCKNSFNLIYIDPPFFSKAKYDAVVRIDNENIRHLAYEDRWKGGMETYLKMISEKIYLMKELLADDGLIWVHLDWHSVHYVKVIMDEIFGENHFVNEIIWTYKSGGSNKKSFSKKHDTILVYSKRDNYKFYPLKEKSYNRGYKPYRFKGVREFQDEIGWYTEVNMKDVWHIDMVGRTSKERTGYATQKPTELIKRIILSSTREGDLCGDFFSGSGTLAEVARELNRQFICCDENLLAIESTINRLAHKNFSYSVYRYHQDFNKHLDCRMEIYKEILKRNLIKYSITLADLKEKNLEDMIIEKELENVQKIYRKNSTALINSWSIDWNFDGITHRPMQFFCERKTK